MTRPDPVTPDTPDRRQAMIDPDFEVLREVETAWLADTLGSSIANLGYPVGCGVPPHPEHLRRAATLLFERYGRMIQMARAAAQKHADDSEPQP